MKCPKTVPAMLRNGEVKRPERPCADELQILEPGLGSCPYHGLVDIAAEVPGYPGPVEVIDNITVTQARLMEEAVAKANGKKTKKAKKKGRKNRG